MASVEPYRLTSGKVAYKAMCADLATKLRLREAELAAIPKPVRVICRVVARIVRGRG